MSIESMSFEEGVIEVLMKKNFLMAFQSAHSLIPKLTIETFAETVKKRIDVWKNG